MSAARRPARAGAAALLAALTGWGAASASPPATPLTQGTVLEREIAIGDTHRYAIDLRAGQYLQLLVEQKGADVLLSLTGPDGAPVIETDSSCGPIGPDPLAVVAGQTGRYELTLTTGDVSRAPRGRYEIRVEAIREPTAVDRARVMAVREGVEAWHAVPSDWRAAFEHSSAALRGWEAAGDRRMQMWVQSQIGSARGSGFDEGQEDAEWQERALATALALHDEWAEAYIRYRLSQAQWRIGRTEEARANLERALALHRAAGRDLDEESIQVTRSLGSFYSRAGEPQVALDYLYDALRRFQTIGNVKGAAWAHTSIARAYLLLGDSELGIEHYRLAVAGAGGDAIFRAKATSGMGDAHVGMGELAQAREAYLAALALYEKGENALLKGDAYMGLGDVQAAEGDLSGAAATFTSALALYRSRAFPGGETLGQCGLGEIHRRLGDRDAARAAFEAARASAPPVASSDTVCVDEGLARLALDSGQLDQARAHAERAVAIAEASRVASASPRSRAASQASWDSAYVLLMDTLMRQHEADPAGGHDTAAFEVAERERARSLLEVLGEGGADVRRGVAPELLAEERSLRRRLNMAAATRVEGPAAGGAPSALDLELDHLSAQLAETESHIRRASPRYAALTQTQPLTLAAVRARVLDPDTQLLQYVLGEERSTLWVVSGARLESFRLGPGAAIEAAARRLHDALSAPPTSGAGGREPLEAARRELSRLLVEPAAHALTAARLLVVAPGALQYVPLGALSLPDGTVLLKRFEVVSAPSASVVATLRDEAALRRRASRTLAVFADPVFEPADPRLAAAVHGPGHREPERVAAPGATPGEAVERVLSAVRGRGAGGGLGRLPFSRREADTIVSLVPARMTWKATGFAASREAATSARLARYRIVHFATHGVLDTRRPELSGIVLSLFDRAARRQDGFLRLHDISDLRLGADLVVLSGCQTGLGKDLRGEGLMGLTRGFMYAGARSVVASLWQVDDESTAELMKRFYRGMLKEKRRPADALRAAQLEMSRDRRWAPPFYWAGFVLQGEWR